MNILRTKNLCSWVLLYFGLATPAAFSADLSFAYRGAQLGDGLVTVRNAIAGKFPLHKEQRLEDVITVVGSDTEGAIRNGCPVSAPPALAANCLHARFIHWPGEGGLKLTIITVSQSFLEPVLASSVLEKLRSAYGQPRRIYEDAEVAADKFSSKDDDLVLIWGGEHTPMPPYRPSSIFAEEYSVIGGKYITAVIHRKGRTVSGYELVIADSDRTLSTIRDWKTRREQGEAAKQRENVKSIKF